MNNKVYFKYSQENDDIILDFSKPEGVLVLNKSLDEDETALMVANHKLIELITTYKTIRNDNSFDVKSKSSVIEQIIKIIETTNFINYSSFCVYLQVVGYSFNTYNSEKNSLSLNEKIELMESIVNLYIDNRHDLYSFHGYSDQVLQVNSDAASSRRKGKTGIEKMEEVLIPLGFKKAKNLLELKNLRLCYILPDKGDIVLFNSLLKENNIMFEFRTTRENKNPDMLFKVDDDYYILEHKLTNGGGGSQNYEINEIIQFVNYAEKKDNWHYVSCLQGNFFKKLNKFNSEPKAANQYRKIIENLNKNPNNYFINGKGFEKLVNDLVEVSIPEPKDVITLLNEYVCEK